MLFQKSLDSHPITTLFDLDPSKYLEFFVPLSEQLTSVLFLQHQKSDFILTIVRTWLQTDSKPLKETVNITGKKGLNQYYERFEHSAMIPIPTSCTIHIILKAFKALPLIL